MIHAMLAVVEQVAILFLMMAVGYVCSRRRIISSRGAAQLANLLFYVVTPCLIVSSLLTDSGGISMRNILVALLLSGAGVGLAIVSSYALFRRVADKRRRNLLRFAAVYSNCGFLGLPLAQAVLGNAGVVYASAGIVSFNLFVWTHGYSIIGGGSSRDSLLKKMLFNPGTISFCIGLPLFAFSVKLPEVLLSPIQSIGGMNTPLAMIVVGTYIAKLSLRDFFSDADVYRVVLYRLILLPLVYLGLACLVNPDPEILITSTILLSAPVAGNTVLFAVLFGGDAKLACKTVALTTLLSIFTMPVMTMLAEKFSGFI